MEWLHKEATDIYKQSSKEESLKANKAYSSFQLYLTLK